MMNGNESTARTANILIGSSIGIGAGLLIYIILSSIGVNFGGFESSLIIGLPSVLGMVTSLVIF